MASQDVVDATSESPTRPPAPPPSRRTSILPAAVVLLLAVGTITLFAIVDATTSSTTATTTLPLVVHGGLRPDPQSVVFRGEVESGTPPADVATALLAPVGATRVARLETGGGANDLETRIAVHAGRPELLGFYETNLRRLGWTLYSSVGGSGNSDDLLFQKAGSDGNYWEVGIVADPPSAGVTTYTLRLFQVDSVM